MHTGLTYGAKKVMRPREYIPTIMTVDEPVCCVIGAIAHGSVNAPYIDEELGVSEYPMSAAGVCGKITDAFEEFWSVL